MMLAVYYFDINMHEAFNEKFQLERLIDLVPASLPIIDDGMTPFDENKIHVRRFHGSRAGKSLSHGQRPMSKC